MWDHIGAVLFGGLITAALVMVVVFNERSSEADTIEEASCPPTVTHYVDRSPLIKDNIFHSPAEFVSVDEFVRTTRSHVQRMDVYTATHQVKSRI